MVREALRIIGVICLGGAVLAVFSWQEATDKLFPVDKIIDLQAKKVVSISFVSAAEVSENPSYLIEL